MEPDEANLDARLAGRLRGLRGERGLSLDRLAERSGVSRSMISLIERGESSPTANVLDKLAAALGVSLASMFTEAPKLAGDPVCRRAEQFAWRDPETGYVRRNLSPSGFASPIELVEVELPPGARVALETATRARPLHQQIWMLEGELHLSVGERTHDLAAGDCLAMRVDQPSVFRNLGALPARYLVALAAENHR